MLGYAELDGDAPLFASTRRRKLLWPAVALALGIVGCAFVLAGQAWDAASAIPSEVGEAPDAATDAPAATSEGHTVGKEMPLAVIHKALVSL